MEITEVWTDAMEEVNKVWAPMQNIDQLIWANANLEMSELWRKLAWCCTDRELAEARNSHFRILEEALAEIFEVWAQAQASVEIAETKAKARVEIVEAQARKEIAKVRTGALTGALRSPVRCLLRKF